MWHRHHCWPLFVQNQKDCCLIKVSVVISLELWKVCWAFLRKHHNRGRNTSTKKNFAILLQKWQFEIILAFFRHTILGIVKNLFLPACLDFGILNSGFFTMFEFDLFWHFKETICIWRCNRCWNFYCSNGLQ